MSNLESILYPILLLGLILSWHFFYFQLCIEIRLLFTYIMITNYQFPTSIILFCLFPSLSFFNFFSFPLCPSIDLPNTAFYAFTDILQFQQWIFKKYLFSSLSPPQSLAFYPIGFPPLVSYTLYILFLIILQFYHF